LTSCGEKIEDDPVFFNNSNNPQIPVEEQLAITCTVSAMMERSEPGVGGSMAGTREGLASSAH